MSKDRDSKKEFEPLKENQHFYVRAFLLNHPAVERDMEEHTDVRTKAVQQTVVQENLKCFFFIKYKPEPDSPQLLINWLSDFSKCMVSAESLHLLSATHSNKGLLYSLPSIVNIFLLLGKSEHQKKFNVLTLRNQTLNQKIKQNPLSFM